MADAQTRAVPIVRLGAPGPAHDVVAVEAALEIRLGHDGPDGQRAVHPLSVTLRTPGHDLELAVGLLRAEGIIESREDIIDLRCCGSAGEVVRVDLRPGLTVDLGRQARHLVATAACGVCGKASLDGIGCPSATRLGDDGPWLDPAVLHALPEKMLRAQAWFTETGGVHAAGLFSASGVLESLREDVGRHNAVDKVVGRALLDGMLPLDRRILVVSGRAGYELVQKAIMARIPVLAAIGAPSSLSVALAAEFGLTLVGFLSHRRANVYSGAGRLLDSNAVGLPQEPA